MADALPIVPRDVTALTRELQKRTHELFAGSAGQRAELDETSARRKLSCKIRDEYSAVAHLPPPMPTVAPVEAAAASGGGAGGDRAGAAAGGIPTAAAPKAPKADKESALSKLIDELPSTRPTDATGKGLGKDKSLVLFKGDSALATVGATESKTKYTPSASVIKRMAAHWPRPDWHAPWKLYRVISGHLGWVRSLAVDPSNEWFVTGSADRCIKIWDLASGQLKLTLTGHIEQVTGVCVSDRHPYMFSVALDKMVKCWDLEYNKVIRHYHGHLSGVYTCALHPGLDLLMTGGRDSACRVWDMRTKAQVFCLSGHDNTVASILCQKPDPQVITGSYDNSIKMWDLKTGKTMSTLTYHKKSIRAMVMHPEEFAFASASADNVKKFGLPAGTFLHNMLQNQKTIINGMALSADNVMATGGDNGSLWFWDWKSGNCFQREETIVQPGSLESEAAIYACAFDHTGSRLITAEADKTIKMWKEDENATPETHPIQFVPPRELRRY